MTNIQHEIVCRSIATIIKLVPNTISVLTLSDSVIKNGNLTCLVALGDQRHLPPDLATWSTQIQTLSEKHKPFTY